MDKIGNIEFDKNLIHLPAKGRQKETNAKISYPFKKLSSVLRRLRREIVARYANELELGSDFTIEFFSILVLRREGRQGRVH